MPTFNFDKQLQKAGIFSLTENPLNELMWAHYGENSKGIAIGFSTVENSLLTNKDKCLKVDYSDELPKFDSDGFILETNFYSNGKNKQQWRSYKNSLNRKYAEIQIRPDSVQYFRHPKYSRIAFVQNYRSSLKIGRVAHSSRGTKSILIAKEKGKFKIIDEYYTPRTW